MLLDLEDAVAPGSKSMARRAIAEWLRPDKPVYPRINGPESPWFVEDLPLLALSGVRGVVVPKAEDPNTIARVTQQCSPGLPVIPLISHNTKWDKPLSESSAAMDGDSSEEQSK